MWNLKHGTNTPIYETETEPHHRNKTGGLPRGRELGRDGVGGWG